MTHHGLIRHTVKPGTYEVNMIEHFGGDAQDSRISHGYVVIYEESLSNSQDVAKQNCIVSDVTCIPIAGTQRPDVIVHRRKESNGLLKKIGLFGRAVIPHSREAG